MGVAADVTKYINLFVDGRGYAGEVDDFNPPSLSIKTEDYRAGGMDTSVPLDMGMEKLEASWNMISDSADIQAQFGVVGQPAVPVVFREAIESFDGTVKSVVYTMRGRIRQIDPGTKKSGDKPTNAYTIDLVYYRKEIDGAVIHEIDVENMKRIVNGVDQLEAHRAAIGL